MIGRKSFLIVVFKSISAFLGGIGLLLIGTYFSPAAYGSIAWTMSLLAVFNSFADLGFTSAHIKRVSEGKNLSDCVSTYASIRLTLTVIMVTLVSLGLFIWTSVLGRPLTDTSVELIVLFILYYIFYDISTIATATFDARTQTAKSQLSLIMDALVRVPLILVLAVPSRGGMDLAFCYVAGGLAVMVTGLFLMRGEGIKLRKPTLFRSYYAFALPMMLVAIAGIATTNIDKIVIGFFWTNTEVGKYAAGQTILSMIAIISSSVGVLLYPTISRINEIGDRTTIREIVEKAERYLSFVLFPIVCVLVVFPDAVALVILPNNYTGAGESMRYLTLAMLINSLGGIYSTHIIAVNRVREVVWLSFLQFGSLAVLLIILVPNVFLGVEMMGMGAVGAAIASLLAIAITMSLYRIMVWKMVHAGLNPRMLLHILAGALTVAVLVLIGQFFQPERWYGILATWLIASGTFFSIVYILRELRNEDISYFLEIINPKGILSYVMKELRPKR